MEGLLVSLLTSSISGGTTTMSANLVLSKLFFCLVLLYLIQNLVLIGRKEGKHNKTCSALLRMHSQQTFVLMKTFWKCRSSSSSEEVLIKTNNRLTHTSSEVVLIKVNIFYIYMFYMFSGLPKRLQDVLKTSLQGVSQRCLQDVWSS